MLQIKTHKKARNPVKISKYLYMKVRGERNSALNLLSKPWIFSFTAAKTKMYWKQCEKRKWIRRNYHTNDVEIIILFNILQIYLPIVTNKSK